MEYLEQLDGWNPPREDNNIQQLPVFLPRLGLRGLALRHVGTHICGLPKNLCCESFHKTP